MREYELNNVTIDDVTSFLAYVVKDEDWNGFALPYFTLEEGKNVCDYLNTLNEDKWIVVNLTDGIEATPPLTKVKAEEFKSRFPLRYATQGYYLTSNGEKIDPLSVSLVIKQISTQALTPDSYFDKGKDSFIVFEQGENEPIEFHGEDVLVNGQMIHLYPIGTGSWIWFLE